MCAIVTMKKGEGRSLKQGGLWIYDNEIDIMEEVYDETRRLLKNG